MSECKAMKELGRSLASLAVFAISFAFVEAAIVEYLRFVWQPIHAGLFPDVPADSIFPIIRPDQLEAEGPQQLRLLYTELVREGATLLMLGAVALAVARNFRQWFAGFMIAFGIWDIFFYVFLKVLLDWPESVETWDLLFLLPVPWVGPVWSPVLVSLTMIGSGTLVLAREAIDRPLSFQWMHVGGIGAGGLIVIIAFCWDCRNILAAGEPNSFHWPLFLAGLAVGLGSFLHVARSGNGPRRSQDDDLTDQGSQGTGPPQSPRKRGEG